MPRAALTAALPGFLNLGDLATLADEKGGLPVEYSELRTFPIPERPEDEEGPGWETYSLFWLIWGLVDAGHDVRRLSYNNATLVNEDHWVDFAEEQAREIGQIEHVAPDVDWDRYARRLRIDYTEVEVEHGEFKGKWLIRS